MYRNMIQVVSEATGEVVREFLAGVENFLNLKNALDSAKFFVRDQAEIKGTDNLIIRMDRQFIQERD